MTGFDRVGLKLLEDKPSKPNRVWNRIPDDIRRVSRPHYVTRLKH